MSKQRRGNTVTNRLVGIFMTQAEKDFLKAAVPDNKSISEYGREILIEEAKKAYTKKKNQEE